MRAKRRAIRLLSLYLLVFLASLLVHAVWNKPFLLDRDEAHLIKRSLAVMAGERPLVDFLEYTYPPGLYGLLAGLFGLFGPTLGLERAVMTVFRAAASTALFGLGRKSLPPGWSLVPLLFHWAVPGLSFRAPFIFLLPVGALVLRAALATPKPGRLASAGAAAGLVLWFRQDLGLILLAALGAGLVLWEWQNGRAGASLSSGDADVGGRRLVRRFLIVGGGAAAAFAPLPLLYALSGSAGRLLHGMFIGSPRSWLAAKKLESESFPSPGRLLASPVDWNSVFQWASAGLVLAAAIILVVKLVRRDGDSSWREIFPAWFFSLAFFYQAVQSPNLGALTQNPLLFGFLAPYLASASLRKASQARGRRRIASGLGGGLAAAAVVAFVVLGLTHLGFNERFATPSQRQATIRLGPDVGMVREQLRWNLQGLIDVLSRERGGQKTLLVLESSLLVHSGRLADLPKLGLRAKRYRADTFVREAERTRPDFVAVDTWACWLFGRLPGGFPEAFDRLYAPLGLSGGFRLFRRL